MKQKLIKYINKMKPYEVCKISNSDNKEDIIRIIKELIDDGWNIEFNNNYTKFRKI